MTIRTMQKRLQEKTAECEQLERDVKVFMDEFEFHSELIDKLHKTLAATRKALRDAERLLASKGKIERAIKEVNACSMAGNMVQNFLEGEEE